MRVGRVVLTVVLLMLLGVLVVAPLTGAGGSLVRQSYTVAAPPLRPTPGPSWSPCCTWFLGDINGDLAVDVLDFSLLCSAYGSHSGEPRYLQSADLDCDGAVDEIDFTLLQVQYGRKVPVGRFLTFSPGVAIR